MFSKISNKIIQLEISQAIICSFIIIIMYDSFPGI